MLADVKTRKKETDQFGTRSRLTPVGEGGMRKEQLLTLPPFSSAEWYLALNEFQHVKLEHRVLDLKYSFQDRLLL